MNDNDNNNENVLDFTKLRAQRGESQVNMNQADSKKSSVRSGTFELHLHPLEGTQDEIIKVSGYLKFGPQFIAVVDGPQDESQVLFAVQTHLVRFVKMLSEDESHTQATLDLNT